MGAKDDVFIVSDRIRELAKEKGWPDPENEVERFLNYHEMTGWKMKNGLKIVSKEAAFRHWLGNASKFKSKVYTQDPKPIKSREDRPNEPVAFDPKVTDMVHNLAKKFAGEE